MRYFVFRLLAVVSLAAVAAAAPARPRYGGQLRLQMRSAARAFDPAIHGDARAAGVRRLLPLVFEPLVALDALGRPVPMLAARWHHDEKARRWSFVLRAGVELHDGTLLAPEALAAALGASSTLSIRPASDGVTIEAEQPLPALLEELAAPARGVVARGGGAAAGTGPFRIERVEPGKRIVLAANERHWGGRPFVDGATIDMGRPEREQLLDLELGRADVVELVPAEVRRAEQRGFRIWSSAPVEVLALIVDRSLPGPEAAALREALSLAVDRAAIHAVLLQRRGEVTAALLPQWLSGYAFLFPPAKDAARARRLLDAAKQRPALGIGFDGTDALARSVAERIAVDAREVGLALKPGGAAPGVRLVRLSISSASPAAALAEIGAALGAPPLARPAVLEAVYAAEKALIEEHRVVPLVHLPVLFAASPRVRAWKEPVVSWLGTVRLEDLWLDSERP